MTLARSMGCGGLRLATIPPLHSHMFPWATALEGSRYTLRESWRAEPRARIGGLDLWGSARPSSGLS